VSLTHGEGFGLPLFEAAYNGLPIIAPSWSGHKDFLHAPKKIRKKNKKTVTKLQPHFSKVKYSLMPVSPDAVWEGVVQPDAMWCYADEESYKSEIRKVFNRRNDASFRKDAKNLQNWILDNFKEEDLYKKFVDCIPLPQIEDLDSWFEELSGQVVEHT
tara:strand:- start:928 stop:1401 length:474 start_codon:yes stop_codon:yes gene_type:complete